MSTFSQLLLSLRLGEESAQLGKKEAGKAKGLLIWKQGSLRQRQTQSWGGQEQGKARHAGWTQKEQRYGMTSPRKASLREGGNASCFKGREEE